jgi:hypothetical protein
MFRDVEMKNPVSIVFDDEETIQDSKGEGRHGEEVHGCVGVPVIPKEGSPVLAGLFPRVQALEISGNSAFGEVEAKFEKFTVNPWSAPGLILLRHLLDESLKLGIDRGPAKASGARTKAPEQPKAGSMPGHNGFRFDEDQGTAPCRPKTAEQNPKYPIVDSQPRARMFSLEYAQLLTEGKNLQTEVVTGTEDGFEKAEEIDEKRNRSPGFIA